MKAYAYKNTENIVNTSSSGGAFSKIISTIDSIFNQNVCYYGAIWTDKMEVRHVKANNLKECDKFKGSKYAKSNLSGILQSIQIELENGKVVVFSGTPCQVNALNIYLKNKDISTKNLYTIDIICHGTPYPKVLSDYIKWIEKRNKKKVIDINFRDKRIGWKNYPTSVKFCDNTEKVYTYETQTFMRLFLSLLILEKKCFKCNFSNIHRVSDITIGDFWGIENISPELFSKNGVSLILSNTEKGNQIIKTIVNTKEKDETLQMCKDNSFIKYQHNLHSTTNIPSNYDEFWRDYNTYGFEYTIKKYKLFSLKGFIKFQIKVILIKFKLYDRIFK